MLMENAWQAGKQVSLTRGPTMPTDIMADCCWAMARPRCEGQAGLALFPWRNIDAIKNLCARRVAVARLFCLVGWQKVVFMEKTKKDTPFLSTTTHEVLRHVVLGSISPAKQSSKFKSEER